MSAIVKGNPEPKALVRAERAPQTVAEVRKDLEESRKRLTSSADALRGDLREGLSAMTHGASELKDKLNWKSWVAKNPWACVAGAVAVGIFLGSRSRS